MFDELVGVSGRPLAFLFLLIFFMVHPAGEVYLRTGLPDPREISAEISAEVSAEISAEISADISAEISDEISAEVSAEISTDTGFGVGYLWRRVLGVAINW